MSLSTSLILSLLSALSELFTTEHAHVRMLSVLQVIFAKPLEKEELLTRPELDTIFPSLDEIIEMHSKGCCKEVFVTRAKRLNIAPFFQITSAPSSKPVIVRC